jgi:arylformamidase
MSWIFLSYEMSEELSGYGNGERIKIKKSKQMCCGDTSNNTDFWMPTHFGTHVDFPFHFSTDGKTASSYSADDFIFSEIHIQLLDLRGRENKLIGTQDLLEYYPPDSELLIIKTFYCHIREQEGYWENGPGFSPEVARLLKEKMPNLKAIAFDSISLTNFQNRELGRVAHKSFLKDYDLLIIEDVDLKQVDESTSFTEVIVSPLRMKNADGAPVTIMARRG